MFLSLTNVGDSGIIYKYISDFPLLSGIILVPLSIAIGLIMNTYVFLYMFRSISTRFCKENIDFIQFEEKVKNVVYKHYKKDIYSCNESQNTDEIQKHTKIYALLLCKNGVETMEYIKSNYWYYMEFQLNFVISVFFVAVTSIKYIIHSNSIPFKSFIFLIFIIIAIAYLLIKFLYKAAYVNYVQYKKQEISVVVGAFHICLEDER